MSTKNMSKFNVLELPTPEQIEHILGPIKQQLLALPRESAQLLITQGLAKYQARHQTMLDTLVGDHAGIVTMRITVDRTLNGRQVFDYNRRQGAISYKVADSAPLVEGEGKEKVLFVFVKTPSPIKPWDVESERQKHGLRRDLAAQVQANIDRPDFAITHPNGDSWPDRKGRWCNAVFGRLNHYKHWIDVRREGWGFLSYSWIGGVFCN